MLMNTVGVRVAVKVRVAVSVFSEESGRAERRIRGVIGL